MLVFIILSPPGDNNIRNNHHPHKGLIAVHLHVAEHIKRSRSIPENPERFDVRFLLIKPIVRILGILQKMAQMDRQRNLLPLILLRRLHTKDLVLLHLTRNCIVDVQRNIDPSLAVPEENNGYALYRV